MNSKKINKPLTILGLDPGTAITGWGVITEEGKEPKLKAFLVVLRRQKHKDDFTRLKEIAEDLNHIISTYKPDEVAVEDLFFFKNLKTAIKVAQARGVLLLTIAQQGLSGHEYTPLQVKQALTGYGRAEETPSSRDGKECLVLNDIPKPDDAADALAVAICHQQSRRINQLK